MSRLIGVLVGVVVLAGGGFALLKVFESRDESGVAVAPSATGDCPSKRVNVTRDAQRLSDDEVRTALAQGNVIVFSMRPRDFTRLQREVSGPFDPELAAAGQMVILARGGLEGGVVEVRAWGRELEAAADDPEIKRFAEQHLGRGAGGAC